MVCCALPFFLCAVPNFAQFVPNRYTLILADPPVASRFEKRADLQSAAAIAYRSQIEAKQKQVMNELAGRGIQVTGSTSVLINAIYVSAPGNRVSEMLSVPGVVAARPMHRYKRALNAATQLMQAPAAWTAVGGQGNAGMGIKIAVLDTGIDQTHPAFQDSTLPTPAGFPICDSFNQPNCSSYTNNKVIVARSYVRQLAGFSSTGTSPTPLTSMPDDYTPRDRDGHGTAVASAAAGEQNTGAAVAATGGALSFSGMAPKAYLGNYKIYGTDGVNDTATDAVLEQAITDVMTDGFDIAVVSAGTIALTGATDTGATCGQPAGTACDPLAAAFEAAAEKGLVIVAAVGDSGADALIDLDENYPYFNSIESPATAPSLIGVGATVNSHVLTPSVSVSASSAASNLKGIAAALSDSGFYITPTIINPLYGAYQAPLVDVSQLGDAYACSALPAGSLNGAYALIEQSPSSNSSCTFAASAANAQAAGAAGIIYYMNSAGALSFPMGLCSFLGPAVLIGNSDGSNLKTYIDANPNALVTIDTGGMETPLATYDTQQSISPPVAQNELAGYSSFGPAPDGSIKPDLVATGGFDPTLFYPISSGLYMAGQDFDPNGSLYSTNRYAAADGTSFAAPLVAGAAALVLQAHPTYSAAQIKSALVNYAAQDTTTDDGGNAVTAEWLGAGRLDAANAVNAAIGVEPSTVSFGFVSSGTTLPVTKALTVTNPGSAAVTLAVAVVASATASGATVAVSPTSLSVPAGGSATLNVTLSGSVPSPGSYTGQITMQATNISLQVPYMFLAGTGVAYNVLPFLIFEGIPGQDVGAGFVQIVDQYGVPVAGQAVALSASSGAMTFNSVSGEPACTGSGSNSVTCNTDNYGFAYADVVLGSSAGTPTITVAAGGIPGLTGEAFILPQPAITPGQIVDNAAFQPTIAPGSIVAIKGSNLMDTLELVNTTLGYDVSATPFWEPVLDFVNVSFDVPAANISVPAPIVAVSASQINVQVPWELSQAISAGQTSAQVKVIIDETIFSNVATANMATYTPAFFTYSANGATIADALNPSYQVITSSNPAIPGNYIMLYANGLGPVATTPADGFAPAANTNTTQACTVSIGGQPATVAFCGQPEGLAIYQVNVQVPTNLTSGNQPITISVGGNTSPSGVVIPVQ
jgi:minor extracellular serine protease Vpr